MTEKKEKKVVKKGTSNAEAIASIAAIADYMHHTIISHCADCGRPMTPSDVYDYGSLCESCYMREYYD